MMRRHLAALMFLCAWLPAYAGPGEDALARFFSEVRTFSAGFTQTVLDPTLHTLSESQGRVYIRRPGQFRWDYAPPDHQQIIGDGERVWVYDIDLEQITVRPQQNALGESAALLLSGDGNLGENYEVEEIGRQGPYDWVELRPALPEAEDNFTHLRLGFADSQLRALEMIDRIDQRSRILLGEVAENADIAAALFDFEPPEGVEVLEVE